MATVRAVCLNFDTLLSCPYHLLCTCCGIAMVSKAIMTMKIITIIYRFRNLRLRAVSSLYLFCTGCYLISLK